MYPIPGGQSGTTFSSPRWTVAALLGVRLAVAGRLRRRTGSLQLTGRVHANAVADRRAAARFDAHPDRTNRWRRSGARRQFAPAAQLAEAIEDAQDASALEEIKRIAIKQLRMIAIGVAGWRSGDSACDETELRS
jgi:hypothetical protein